MASDHLWSNNPRENMSALGKKDTITRTTTMAGASWEVKRATLQPGTLWIFMEFGEEWREDLEGKSSWLPAG